MAGLLCVGLATLVIPAGEVGAGLDGPNAGALERGPAAGPNATGSAETGSGVGSGPVRGFSPSPGPGDPGVGSPETDRATVVRGPVFLRGAPRSGDSLIAASRGRTCAVRRSGTVTCWGQDGIRERLSAASLKNVVSISTGDHPHQELHVCARHGDGTVSCWGPGRSGQLGRGEHVSGYLPEKVPGIADAVALAAGSDHTCAVHASGEVSCWGAGALGQLGDGLGRSASSPQKVAGLERVARIDAGPSSNCAIHVDGGLSCWGYGGGAGNNNAFGPAQVEGLPPVVSVSTGWDRTCAATIAGDVYCWPVGDRAQPAPVDGISGVAAVSVGDGGVCAVHDDGGVSCWGEQNAAGQLGTGTMRPQLRPARLRGITEAVAVTMSPGSTRLAPHTCVAHESGSYSCWGGNGAGQVGDGVGAERPAPTPVAVPAEIPKDRIPADETGLLRIWVDEAVVQNENRFPWLRVAWDHIRDRAVAGRIDDLRGAVRSYCSLSDGSYDCAADSMEIAEMTLGDVVHELAHVYDGTTGLAPGKAWGAVQLYFARTYPDCFRDYGQRPGAEILADAMAHVVVPTAWLAYYGAGCPGLGGEPDRAAEEVILAGLAGVVPDWYSGNITNGAELWAVLRRALSASLLANLAGEFGGFCSTDWFSYPLDWSEVPAARTNPFRDGSC